MPQNIFPTSNKNDLKSYNSFVISTEEKMKSDRTFWLMTVLYETPVKETMSLF
jgi:hypothetical protein